jgi:hypothetical protein
MFVAGLNTPNRDRSASILSTTTSSRRGSISRLAPPSASLSFTSPLTSPGPSNNALPNSPPVDETEKQLGSVLEDVEKSEKDREFEELSDNLRKALLHTSGKGKVWLHETARKDFRILLVDKVCLPRDGLMVEREITPTQGRTPKLSQWLHSTLSLPAITSHYHVPTLPRRSDRSSVGEETRRTHPFRLRPLSPPRGTRLERRG